MATLSMSIQLNSTWHYNYHQKNRITIKTNEKAKLSTHKIKSMVIHMKTGRWCSIIQKVINNANLHQDEIEMIIMMLIVIQTLSYPYISHSHCRMKYRSCCVRLIISHVPVICITCRAPCQLSFHGHTV